MSKRARCPHCLRPLPACYCSALVQLKNRIRLLIIQHPLEAKHPFNTGRMAQLCLVNSELIVAEQLDDKQLADILATPSALLYPSLPWLPASTVIGDADSAGDGDIQQLIVVDATWRKSKKILHLHPALQQLPRLSLQLSEKTRYQTVRTDTVSGGLATIEGIAAAMELLESDQGYRAMLQPFEKMIALQIDLFT